MGAREWMCGMSMDADGATANRQSAYIAGKPVVMFDTPGKHVIGWNLQKIWHCQHLLSGMNAGCQLHQM